jgi:hypothetical protein
MTAPRIIIKPLRVSGLDDPKVQSVASGEGFVVENITTTEQYYKRAIDGVIVQLGQAGSGGGSGGPTDWSQITGKPAVFYVLAAASASNLGGVKVGTGLTMGGDGTLSVTPNPVPLATANSTGVIKVGSGLNMAADGTLSAIPGAVPLATTGVAGIVKVGSGLTVAGDGTIAAVPQAAAASNVFEFTVAFTGANPSGTANLPAGWNASISGNDITVTHTVGRPLKLISYWGYSVVGGVERYRLPSASNEASIPYATRNTQFTFRISTAVSGADSDSTARVVLAF